MIAAVVVFGRAHLGGWIFVIIALLGTASAASARPPQMVDAGGEIIDQEPNDCIEAYPTTYGLPPPVAPSEKVVLDVLVLLNWVSLEDGRQAMADAARAYEPLGIELAPVFQEVRFEPEGYNTDADGNKTYFTDPDVLIEHSRAFLGGARPATVDVVYTMTGHELDGPVAGKADCIGGVRFPESAFAVGEWTPEQSYEPFAFFQDVPGKIAAHEIGHLMGGHHHYANCVEGIEPEDVTGGDAFALCTTMINDIGLASLKFSTTNSAIVRGFAEDFAASTPTVEPIHQRSVTLGFRGPYAEGTVESETEACRSGVSVEIQQLRGGKWITVASDNSYSNSIYSIETEGRGRFRAYLPPHAFVGEQSRETCAKTYSIPIRRRD